MNFITFISVLLFFIAISTKHVKSCDLSKAYLPVDSTCKSYYICEGDQLKVENCPDDQKWDSTFFSCVPSNIVLPGCFSEIATPPPTIKNNSNRVLAFNFVSFSFVLFLVICLV